MTIRRIGDSEPVEVLAPDELARRKEEEEWRRYERRHGLDVREEHARLALRLGAAITVPEYTGDLWWFVRDVNGPERTITAGTIIFGQVRERSFPFDLVEPKRLWHWSELNEAAEAYRVVEQALGRVRTAVRKPRAA